MTTIDEDLTAMRKADAALQAFQERWRQGLREEYELDLRILSDGNPEYRQFTEQHRSAPLDQPNVWPWFVAGAVIAGVVAVISGWVAEMIAVWL